nr:YciI family protein [Candidatus Microthrix sp.]
MRPPRWGPPVTDGPFAESKDLIAGWLVIDVESEERAIEIAGELSAAPGAGGEPSHEWLELRKFMSAPRQRTAQRAGTSASDQAGRPGQSAPARPVSTSDTARW